MTPRDVAECLEISIGIDGKPRRLQAAIEVELSAHFGMVAIRAAERAEALMESVGRIIAERAVRAETGGVIATLVLLGSTNDLVAGSSFVLASDSSDVVSAKLGRTTAQPLLRAIRDLSFAEFEAFGARVLREIGAANATVTPHSGDQGIDFFGDFRLGKFTGLPPPFTKLAHDVEVLFAGQAKHYPTRALGPDIVRELVGAISLARTKTFSTNDADVFEGLRLRPLSPLVPLLFTTGSISRGAVRLADSAGIIARSGEQLAVFLADKGVGMSTTKGRASFNEKKFRQWLSEQP